MAIAMWSSGAKTANNRAANRVSIGLAASLVLLVCSAPLLIWGQTENVGGSNPQLQAPASSSNASPSAPQSKHKSSERIFGVVPAYNITDARSAPPLTPKQKFGLFAKGTLDPFPVAAYAVQAGVSQASDTHSGYGQGLAGYGKRFGAALLDGTSARFSALTCSHPCCVRILAIFGRAREVPGHERAILSLGALLLVLTPVRVNRTGRTSLANLQLPVCRISTIQQRIAVQI